MSGIVSVREEKTMKMKNTVLKIAVLIRTLAVIRGVFTAWDEF